MVSVLAGLTESEPLLAFASPPDQQEAADILERIRADLHPGQLAAKTCALALANQGHTGCVMEPTGPLVRDIWLNDFEAFLERYEIPYTFRASPLPEVILHLPGGDTKILCRSLESWTRIIGLNLSF